MKIVAKLENILDSNKVTVQINETVQELSIPNTSTMSISFPRNLLTI